MNPRCVDSVTSGRAVINAPVTDDVVDTDDADDMYDTDESDDIIGESGDTDELVTQITHTDE